MQAALLNFPKSDLDFSVWSFANAQDHLRIIQGIARQSSVIQSLQLTAGGSGYSSPPTVTIAPPDLPGGTQATATAAFSGSGSSGTVIFTLTNAGLGYSRAPAVTLTGGGGTGLAATAVVNYVQLTNYQVDPIPQNDIEQWLNTHQQLHDDMLSALNLPSTDQEGPDFDDPQSMEAYYWLHLLDHQAATNALLGYLPGGG